MKPLKAFTLIEVALVVTIMAITITMVTAWTMQVLNSAQLQASYETLIGSLRKSQSAALSSLDNNAYGVRFSAGDFTTFAGITYDSSDPLSRETFQFPVNIQLTDISLNGETNDLIFQKGSGETSQYGTLTIDYLPESQPFTINISAIGLID